MELDSAVLLLLPEEQEGAAACSVNNSVGDTRRLSPRSVQTFWLLMAA
jgi:hypothetical protein